MPDAIWATLAGGAITAALAVAGCLLRMHTTLAQLRTSMDYVSADYREFKRLSAAKHQATERRLSTLESRRHDMGLQHP